VLRTLARFRSVNRPAVFAAPSAGAGAQVNTVAGNVWGKAGTNLQFGTGGALTNVADYSLLKLFTLAGANIDTKNNNDLQSILQVDNIRSTAGTTPRFNAINGVNYGLFDSLGGGGQTERALVRMACLNAPEVGVWNVNYGLLRDYLNDRKNNATGANGSYTYLNSAANKQMVDASLVKYFISEVNDNAYN